MEFFSAGAPSGTSNQTLLSKLGLSFTKDDRFVMSESTFPSSAFQLKTSGNYHDPQTKRLQMPKASYLLCRAPCSVCLQQPNPAQKYINHVC